MDANINSSQELLKVFCQRKSKESSQDISVVASPRDIRKGSAAYWKAKFEMAQDIIKEASEKSLNLDEVQGLLPISKVKPKKTVENTQITQICGSMEGKDVLKVVESLKKKKVEKTLAKSAKDEKKREEKMFYKSKEQCVCSKPKYEAAGWRECPNGHNVLRSICGKATCKTNGKCPQMIFPCLIHGTSFMGRHLWSVERHSPCIKQI